MKHVRMFKILAFALFLSLSTAAMAQPRTGEKMPEFQLQGTDGKMYGVKYSDNVVSVLFFVGNW